MGGRGSAKEETGKGGTAAQPPGASGRRTNCVDTSRSKVKLTLDRRNEKYDSLQIVAMARGDGGGHEHAEGPSFMDKRLESSISVIAVHVHSISRPTVEEHISVLRR